MPDICDARPLSQDDARAVITDACILGDATLHSSIDDLWAAATDPDRMRRLLARHRLEVEAARTLLAAAADLEWWATADLGRLDEACRAARIWSEGDPICAELERAFAARLKTFLGIDLAAIPRPRWTS